MMLVDGLAVRLVGCVCGACVCFGDLAVWSDSWSASWFRSCASAACCACVGMGDLSGVSSVGLSAGGGELCAVSWAACSCGMVSPSGVVGVSQSGVGGIGAIPNRWNGMVS